MSNLITWESDAWKYNETTKYHGHFIITDTKHIVTNLYWLEKTFIKHKIESDENDSSICII